MATCLSVNNLFALLFIICQGCVPLQQQVYENEYDKIEGFISPLVINKEEFYRVASPMVYDRMTVDDLLLPSNNNITYEGTFGGSMVYIRNCKCLTNPKIVQNKLVVTHFYGGSGSNRESTVLLWNGEYYQNSKGEYKIDVIMFSNKVDIGRAGITEKKILDVEAAQVKGANFVWINLLGYDQLIKYSY